MRRLVTALVGVVSLALMGSAAAQGGKQIVGLWQLVSDSNTQDGVTKKGMGFGSNPKGQFLFTSNGHYMSINTRSDIPKFASGNRMKGTAEENRAVVHGSIAHFGTYSVTPDGKAFILKVEGGTWPAWVGAGQKPKFTTKADN